MFILVLIILVVGPRQSIKSASLNGGQILIKLTIGSSTPAPLFPKTLLLDYPISIRMLPHPLVQPD